MYHFIDFTPRLFSRNTSENADMIDYLEYYTTPPTYKKIPEKRAGTPTSGFMTSLLVTLTVHMTFGHVTSGCHVGYAE